MSLKRKIGDMAPNETKIIPREEHKPSVVRATCHTLKGDERKEYAVQTIAEGVKVTRIS